MLAIGSVVSATKRGTSGQPYRVEEYLVVRNAELPWPFREAQRSPGRQEAFASSGHIGLLGEIFVLLVPTREAKGGERGIRILPMSAIMDNLGREPGWTIATTSLGEICLTDS